MQLWHLLHYVEFELVFTRHLLYHLDGLGWPCGNAKLLCSSFLLHSWKPTDENKQPADVLWYKRLGCMYILGRWRDAILGLLMQSSLCCLRPQGLIQRRESEWDCGSGLPDLLRFCLRAHCCVGESILSWAGHSINIAQGMQAGMQAVEQTRAKLQGWLPLISFLLTPFNCPSTESKAG